MQTFAPYPDAARSAASLDVRRLGKQRVETYQLLLWMHGVQMWDWDHRIMVARRSSRVHPALRLWSGHERALLSYQEAFCKEWVSLGYNDTCWDKSRYVVDTLNHDPDSEQWPPWWGDEFFHMVHRSNLVYKDWRFYGERFPDVYPHPPMDPDSPENYWGYRWPHGRIPLADRMDALYDHAVTILGTPEEILERKRAEFGWSYNHPWTVAFREQLISA